MLKQLKELKIELEEEAEDSLKPVEIEYLNQIKTAADLTNFSMAANEREDSLLHALAYDAAKAMGLSEDEADIVAGYKTPTVSREEVEKAYDRLVRDYGAAMEVYNDAHYYLVEEMSAEGFVSRESRKEHDRLEEEAQEALNTLNVFKKAHAAAIEQINQERSEANTRSVWNQ